MRPNVKKAVLKILLLQTEFKEKDLSEAVRFISDKSEDDILSFLADKMKIKKPLSEKGASVTDQTSKAVNNLKSVDFEKYKLLKMFDQYLRNNKLLPHLDDIKKFGVSFSKEFVSGKSRKDTIPKLMALLADMPIQELKHAITNIISESEHENSEYVDLANYIIYGHITSKDALKDID